MVKKNRVGVVFWQMSFKKRNLNCSFSNRDTATIKFFAKFQVKFAFRNQKSAQDSGFTEITDFFFKISLWLVFIFSVSVLFIDIEKHNVFFSFSSCVTFWCWNDFYFQSFLCNTFPFESSRQDLMTLEFKTAKIKLY